MKILASYGGDLQAVVDDVEEKVNRFLKELEEKGCTVHRVELGHQMNGDMFSIIVLVAYTCVER